MFTIPYILCLILIGIVAGFTSGLLGVGGGFLITPLQYFLLQSINVENNTAMLVSLATSLAIIIPTSLSGAYKHTRSLKHIIKPGVQLGIFGIIGSAIGAQVAVILDYKILESIFALLLLFISINNLININKESKRVHFKPYFSVIIGIGVGFLSGLLGIGGGVFLIAILTLLLGFSMIEAISTSSIFICLTAIGGCVSYIIAGWSCNVLPYSIGYVNLVNLIFIGISSIPLAYAGAKLSHKLPESKLKIIFSILVIFIALKMLGLI